MPKFSDWIRGKASTAAPIPAQKVAPLVDDVTGVVTKTSAQNFSVVNTETIAFSVDGSTPIAAGETILSFMILPNTNLTAFKVGTTGGGDDIISEQAVISDGKWKSFAINYKAAALETWYIGGIIGTVQVQKVKI
jgi:hypothetical protein